ncbi:flagella synthesis protein FlgN [Gilvimarinus algae]|uniref:Flagellar protein FlgN n=1 Tax=Gilvimarinus algae TaxID=3058037 RepID=A0ABT8TEZ2_9GAMM|nr:flagellar protein FlgN [Gilvimarinus sp. SDUM040014]MDO3382623.1 flagellar protein FlgN [Gilvimarinus sp. SDUM040014]
MSANPALVREMLTADLKAAQALLALLQKESELLKHRDHGALTDLIEAKTQHIELLNAHATERSALLQSLNLPADSNGWQAFMSGNAPLQALLPLWQELQECIAECKALNNINGKLIGRSQQTLQRLLDLVRGKTSTPELYNAKGSATNRALSSSVAKA